MISHKTQPMITQPYIARLSCGVVLTLSLTPYLHAQDSSQLDWFIIAVVPPERSLGLALDDEPDPDKILPNEITRWTPNDIRTGGKFAGS